MADSNSTELQIIISASIEEAKAAIQSIGESATQLQTQMESAGTGASEALSSIQAEATRADESLSTIVEAAAQASEGVSSSMQSATAALGEVAVSADEAGKSVSSVAGGTDAFVALENAVRDLTTQLQQTAEVAAEADTEIQGMGEAAAKAEGEILSFGEAAEKTKSGIEGTQAAMKGFMVIMGAGMLGEFADNAEKSAIQLGQLQAMTGQSSQQVEQLSLVGQAAGLSMSQLSNMVGRMDMRLGRAMSGSSSLSKELANLGVNAEQFAQSNPAGQAGLLESALLKAHEPAKQLASTLKSLGVNAQQFVTASQPQQLQLLATGLQQVQNSGQSVGRMLQDAGINASQFMQLPFSQQMDQIATAFEHTKNRAQATALVMTVFGRQGATMIPLLQNMKEMNDYASQFHLPKMDFNEIQTAAMKTKMLVSIFQIWTTDVITKILPVVDATAKAFFDMASNLNNPIEMIRKMTADIGPLGTAVLLAVSAFQAMKVINSITGTIKAFTETTKAAAVAMKILKIAEEGEAEAEGLQMASWIRSGVALVTSTASKVAATVATGAMTAATTVATAATTAFGVALDIATGPIGLVIAAIAALAFGVYELITHWQQVSQFLKKTWNEIVSEGQKLWNDLMAFFRKWGADILMVIGGPIVILITELVKHWSTIKQDAIAAWNALVNGIKSIISTVITITEAPFIAIGKFFANLAVEAYQWGANLIGNIVHGIESMVSKVKAAVSHVASAIGNFLGFHSPAKEGPGSDADQWAPNFIDMYAGGLNQGVAKIRAAVNNVMSPVHAAFGGGLTASLSQTFSGGMSQTSFPATGGAPMQLIFNVSGNVTRSEQDLADMIATETMRRMKMTTQLP
jgi:hypothetical protein